MTVLFEIDGSVDMETFSATFTPEIRTVIKSVRKYGFDIRVIGGAVRDFILGKSPRDVDFATDAEPAELEFIFELEGIQYDASGIEHGTVKAVFGNDKVDVTSINYRIKVVGDSMMIERPGSWEIESAMRDLTINSMSVDMEGNLYDYQDGQTDLMNQLVRFCPNPEEKIQRDPFTILRWFKGIAMFDQPKWLTKDREVVERMAELVSDVKTDKRTQLLISNLITSPKWEKILKIMCSTGVAQKLDLTCGS